MEIKTDIESSETSLVMQRLGGRIRAARINRRWRQSDLVERSGLSRSTIQAVERGDPTTSIGNVVRILWIMGLAKEIELIADPGIDREGLTLSLDAGSKRVYITKKVDNEF